MKICKLMTTLVLCSGLIACGEKAPRSKAVYMLIDTSGTYTRELNKARKIGNYLLGTLNSGDSLAMARIDSGSFSEKDIISKVTFDMRPSIATTQKHQFKRQLDDFVSNAKPSARPNTWLPPSGDAVICQGRSVLRCSAAGSGTGPNRIKPNRVRATRARITSGIFMPLGACAVAIPVAKKWHGEDGFLFS